MSQAPPANRPVPAVGLVCLRADDVVLVKRGTPPRKGEWSLPGGRIEFGERAEAAALRELLEETGVRAEIAGLIDVVDAVFRSRSRGGVWGHYLLVDYAARWIEGEPKGADDADEARFFTPAELAALEIWDETRRVIDAARLLL